MPEPQKPAALLRPTDVAAITDVSLSTVRHWMATGRLRSIKAGRHRRIPRKALADFLGLDPADLAA